MLPGIAIDARVGEQLDQVQSGVAQLKAEGVVGNRLILELGTNGPYTASQLQELLTSLGPMQKIVLVNIRVPRPWQQQVNDTIAAVARTYPNASVVDWFADSAAYPQYFYPDGVHLDSAGSKYYASLLVQALEAPRAGSRGSRALMH
jgi:lysophospholipase L1-like esterase